MKFLFVVALAAVAFWMFWGKTMAPVSVVDDHLDAISRKDWTAAYDALAEETKKETPFPNFREIILSNEVVADHANARLYDRAVDENFATISGTIQTWAGKKAEARYILVKKADKWVIKEVDINNLKILPMDPLF